MADWIYWMIFAVVMAGIELAVFSIFIFGPLAIAAVATAIVAGAGGGIELQLAVFIVLSLAAMFSLYPIARRHAKSDPKLASNVDALIGKEARTLEQITDQALGLIRFDNANWSARTVDGAAPIAPDTTVTVLSIAGATAIVEPRAAQTTTESQEN
jgi:membrane protein implicated in regulation of membrane protease activity